MENRDLYFVSNRAGGRLTLGDFLEAAWALKNIAPADLEITVSNDRPLGEIQIRTAAGKVVGRLYNFAPDPEGSD